MFVRFDRGTLVFGDVPDGFDLGGVRGVRFDTRVNAWRGRAYEKEAILRDLGRSGVDVVDQTERALGSIDPVPPIDLRPYQEHALMAWEAARRRGVVVLPTGSGKTRLAIAAIARTLCRSLVLVPTRVLLEQWRNELVRAGFHNVGAWGDSHHDIHSITVATMDAAWRGMNRLGDMFELLIVDEVHRSVGATRAEALEMSIAPFRLGLTATPPGPEAGNRVNRLVGPIVHISTVEELAGTFLAPFELVVQPVDLTRAERAVYDRNYTTWRVWLDEERFTYPDAKIAEICRRAPRTHEGRVALEALHRAQSVLSYPAQKRTLIGMLLAEHRERKVLVFTPDNKTAYAIARDHLVAPITCDIGRAERALILDKFRRGELRSLVSSQVLNEGVDVPDADVAIVVGGRAGEREHVQRVGRVLRPSAGKQALVIEIVVSRTTEARKGERRRAAFTRPADGRPPDPAGADTSMALDGIGAIEEAPTIDEGHVLGDAPPASDVDTELERAAALEPAEGGSPAPRFDDDDDDDDEERGAVC